jgi:hypothetical protein
MSNIITVDFSRKKSANADPVVIPRISQIRMLELCSQHMSDEDFVEFTAVIRDPSCFEQACSHTQLLVLLFNQMGDVND